MKSIIRFFKNNYHKIKNLIVWFPIIWKDQDWDSMWLFIIMRKKLQQMEKFQRSKDARHLNAEQDADEIHYCIERLNRLINEHEYLENALKPFYEKFPNYDWDLNNKFIETEFTEPGWVEYVNNDPPEQKALFRDCCKQAEIDEENDLDELFAQLRLHVRDWWD